MATPTPTQSAEPHQSIDLAALGKTWTPPPELDTSPEVADILTQMPRWAARGLLYLIIAFFIIALVWAGLSHVDVVIEARGTLVPKALCNPCRP